MSLNGVLGRNGRRNGRNGRRNGRNGRNGVLGNSLVNTANGFTNGKVRVRRADPKQLYHHCKSTGAECPQDVINKFEHRTPADKILIWGSSGVYFGNLGIGTGSGSGGGVFFGGRPALGRPGIPTGTLGPRDILPIDPSAGHNIPLEQPFGGFGSGTGAGDIELRAFEGFGSQSGVTRPTTSSGGTRIIETTFTEDPSIAAGGPPTQPGTTGEAPTFPTETTEVTIIPNVFDESGNGVDIQVIDPQPVDPGTHVITRTQYSNPTFEIDINTSINAGETSASDEVLVGVEPGGTDVGNYGEYIELTDFSSRDTIVAPRGEPEVEETEFMTSTPERPAVRERMPIRPYGRQYQQVRLSEPAVLVLQENPAFQADVSVIFAEDLERIASGALDFEGLTRLGRPHLQRRPTTGIRVSRIGTRRGTVHTRSGVEIGSAAHFFSDISPIGRPIEPEDAIEMDLIGEQSGEATVVSGPDTGHSMNVDLTALGDNIDNEFHEDNLLEEGDEDEVGENLQLIYYTGDEVDVFTEQVTVPLTTGRVEKPPTVIFSDDGDHVVYPGSDKDRPIPAYPDVTPRVLIDIYGGLDYDLHPSLLRRRCKRRHKCIYY